MHETVRRLEHDEFRVPTWLARWRAPTATLSWVSCGHPFAYLVDGAGGLSELGGPQHPSLGTPGDAPAFHVTRRALRPGERLVLVTDGIVGRQVEGGGTFGTDGIVRALERAESQTAAGIALAIQQAVTDCWKEPLEDDGTIVVMAID